MWLLTKNHLICQDAGQSHSPHIPSCTPQEPTPNHVAVKEVVLPFSKFPGADTLLGPEMRSTGEVMGIDYDFASSYAKAQIAAGTHAHPFPRMLPWHTLPCIAQRLGQVSAIQAASTNDCHRVVLRLYIVDNKLLAAE